MPAIDTRGSAVGVTTASKPRADDDRDARFRRYVVPELDVLARMAGRLCPDTTAAEDLVQETLLRAYRAIATFDGRHPRSWLLTIMRNLRRTAAGRRSDVVLPDDDAAFARLPGAHDERPDVAAVRAGCTDAVVRAVDRLPRAMAEVVELVDMAGLSYGEAARVLDVPLGTVMSRLHRGRHRLSSALAAQGWTPEALAAGGSPSS